MNKHERSLKEHKPRIDAIIFEDKYGGEKYCSKVDIAESFIKYGGRFVHCLGEALLHADAFNSEKLIETWSNYVEDYFNTFILPKENEIHNN